MASPLGSDADTSAPPTPPAGTWKAQREADARARLKSRARGKACGGHHSGSETLVVLSSVANHMELNLHQLSKLILELKKCSFN
ncbi:unnamed protein product [Urochloa humidicola]